MIQANIDRFCKVLSMAMVACLAVMVLLVFGNVVLRYGFNSGLTLSEELSRWLFVWMIFLGAIVALNDGGHLATDTVVSRLSPRSQRICSSLSYLLMLFVCGLVLQGAWKQMLINLSATSAVMQVSLAFFYAAGVVFSAFSLLILLWRFWLSFARPGSDLASKPNYAGSTE
jgi:TRAP-type transport system small permease protein